MRAVLFVIRLVMVIVWSFVFYLAAYLALQYAYIGPLVRAAQPNNPGAVRAAMRPYTVPIFGGSLVLAVTLKLLGVLPGAVRRQSRRPRPSSRRLRLGLPWGRTSRYPRDSGRISSRQ